MSRVLLASLSVLLFVTAALVLSAADHVAAQAIPLACQDADDDGDTQINDGCPQVGTVAESGTQCGNDITNDDAPDDTYVSDGCWAPPLSRR
jgi:hypothetical protein